MNMWLIACIAALWVVHLLLLRRLADVAQPYRLEMAELGESMLEGEMDDERRQSILFCLDNAFSGWVMAFAAIALPIVILLHPFSRHKQCKFVTNKDDQRLDVLFALSAFAANPILGTVVFAEFFVFGLLLIVMFGPQALAAAIAGLMRWELAIPAFRRRRIYVAQ